MCRVDVDTDMICRVDVDTDVMCRVQTCVGFRHV